MRVFKSVAAALLQRFLSTGQNTFGGIAQYLETANMHLTAQHWVNNFLLPNTPDSPVWAYRAERWSPTETVEDEANDEALFLCWICPVSTLHYLVFDGNDRPHAKKNVDLVWWILECSFIREIPSKLPLYRQWGVKSHTTICQFSYEWIIAFATACTVSDWREVSTQDQSLVSYYKNCTSRTWKNWQSKVGCKDQELIRSSNTPDPAYQWESYKLTVIHHKQESRGQPFPKPFPSRWPHGTNKQTHTKA